MKPETAPEDASSQQVEQSAKEPEEKMETSASTETVKKVCVCMFGGRGCAHVQTVL